MTFVDLEVTTHMSINEDTPISEQALAQQEHEVLWATA